jgi:hypothetical protein
MSFVSRNHPQQVATRGPLEGVDDRRTPPDLLAECMELADVDAFDEFRRWAELVAGGRFVVEVPAAW